MKTIDYTKTSIGHGLSIKKEEDGLLRGKLWGPVGANKGDRLIWATPHGTTTGEVIESKCPSDPGDICWVTVEVVARHGHDGVALD